MASDDDFSKLPDEAGGPDAPSLSHARNLKEAVIAFVHDHYSKDGRSGALPRSDSVRPHNWVFINEKLGKYNSFWSNCGPTLTTWKGITIATKEVKSMPPIKLGRKVINKGVKLAPALFITTWKYPGIGTNDSIKYLDGLWVPKVYVGNLMKGLAVDKSPDLVQYFEDYWKVRP